eukprot:327154-Amphidinium_carterae.1
MLVESYAPYWAHPGTSQEETLLGEFPGVQAAEMDLHDITAEQVGAAITSMSKGKAIGVDG